MIICLLGGIGSGKTLSAVKFIADNRQFALTNFKLKNIKDYHRIKVSDIIIKDEEKKKLVVNWDYWEKIRKSQTSFSIYLDEIHNIIHSRRSMSRINILMSKWVSQIRKILSDHPTNHLYIISQTASKIDKDFRDLAQVIIYCQKQEKKKKVYIKQSYYNSMFNLDIGRKRAIKVFCGNPYFRFYKSTELVTFADAEEYI